MSKNYLVNRYLSFPYRNPYDEVRLTTRTAEIRNDTGDVIFKKENVGAPESWSQLAVNICASKYFHQKENSIVDMIDRVAGSIASKGYELGYFKTKEEEVIFYEELIALLINQYGSFNSPVWFNVGVRDNPQCSACFIQSVEDDMDSIMDLAVKEAKLFKQGSGTGTDLSSLRSEKETLSGGGIPSGPLSFLKIYDAVAGVVKSGGKTRRAAKMNLLNVSHPDIKDFIFAKTKEEKKARDLIKAGHGDGMDGGAYESVSYQNENLSVKLSDVFMEAVISDSDWATKWVTDYTKKGPVYKAKDLMKWISEAAWECGDPGVQFEDTINRMNTCKGSGKINASNPCSEFMFLDNSACNLASLNLIKFLKDDGTFDKGLFEHAINVFTLAMDIIVDMASYPTKEIERNSKLFRPLGLGYSNLGALLMSKGLPYDSDEGREYASAITAFMHFKAGVVSSYLADIMGPFAKYDENEESIKEVWGIQKRSLENRVKGKNKETESIFEDAEILADYVVDNGKLRNSQVTLLAPTGTIGFMMDCDTTGIEPDISLVKYKKMVGDGYVKYTNKSIERALKNLNYDPVDIESILSYVSLNGTIEGSHVLKEEHLPIFDCALSPKNGERSISPYGHLEMMCAVQQYLSGAISKTVNMPEGSTVEDIQDVYMKAWEMGLKSVSVYRDGCKSGQPLQTSEKETETGKTKECPPQRKRLPRTRKSITHKFDIGGHEGYFTVGLFRDGDPGELFITMAKEGSTIGGLMDSFGTAVSLGLQYGVPIDTYVNKFSHARFEPSGVTGYSEIPIAKSIMDYIFRWLEKRFVEDDDCPCKKKKKGKKEVDNDNEPSYFTKDAPACPVCGALTIRNGTCYKCEVCGNSLGCS